MTKPASKPLVSLKSRPTRFSVRMSIGKARCKIGAMRALPRNARIGTVQV
jgi:hypothetical protein